MTIPKINSNGDSGNKIKLNTSHQQLEINTNANTPTTTEQAPQPEQQEKEYSITQFKRDYATLVESKVVPILS